MSRSLGQVFLLGLKMACFAFQSKKSIKMVGYPAIMRPRCSLLWHFKSIVGNVGVEPLLCKAEVRGTGAVLFFLLCIHQQSNLILSDHQQSSSWHPKGFQFSTRSIYVHSSLVVVIFAHALKEIPSVKKRDHQIGSNWFLDVMLVSRWAWQKKSC